MSERHEGIADVLARLRHLADLDRDDDTASLRSEYERWKIRFELLAAGARTN